MSEVLTRSLATTSCTLLPIIALLLFGGATLKDFAFALLIGVASGAYSSIFIASPVLTHWKERESQYRHRRDRIVSEHGAVPAYAEGGADVEPTGKRARPAGRLTTPQAETVSAAEFEEMKRELGIEDEAPTQAGGLGRRASRSASGTAAPARPAAGGRTKAQPKPKPAPSPAPEPSAQPTPPSAGDGDGFTPAPDVAENEGMVPGPKSGRPAKGRNRRHGRRR
jgi:SecD/SecF fusion protein